MFGFVKIIFVFFVIAEIIFFGSLQSDSCSTSTKTGIPLFSIMQCAVDTKLNDGKITSLSFILNNESAKFKAEVPLLTAIHSSDFRYFLNSFSNFNTFK